MRQFVLEENIARFQKLLAGPIEAERRRTIELLLLEAQRDLALANASLFGVKVPAGRAPKNGSEMPVPAPALARTDAETDIAAAFQREFEISPRPYLLLDAGPGLIVIDINDAYARATMTVHATVVGRSLFEIFPDNPAGGSGDGVGISTPRSEPQRRPAGLTPWPCSATMCAIPPAVSCCATGSRATRRCSAPTDASCACCTMSRT